MAHDQQTYKRAATAAMIGLAVQLLLAVALTLVALFTRDAATEAASWHLFGGLPIWVILWVLFHQHRLERQEALEAEQLSRSDARTAALFEDMGENLRVARRRLELIEKWWLPIVSLVVGLFLLVVGSVLAWDAYRGWQAGTLAAAAMTPRGFESAIIVSVVLVALGFVGFLVARYLAGMTQVREWTLLRGGAAYLMGSVLLIAILAVAMMVVAFGGGVQVLVAVAIAVPVLTALLGLEILLGFVLGLYRPRRPGDINRPAFDSRFLGLLTRPESIGKTINEAINYQFGFEISASWFYRLLAKAITPLVLVGAAVLIGLTSVVVVSPEQQAVITHNGRIVDVVEPGLHFKLPWPLGRAQKLEAYRVHQIVIGSEGGDTMPNVPILWTNQHTEGQENYLVTASPRYAVEEEAAGTAAAPVDLIGARMVVKYRVDDLRAFMTTAANPRDVLRNIASRRLNTFLSTHTVDQLLAQGRTDAGLLLEAQIAEDLEVFGQPLGIEVVFAGFEAIHPPQEGEVAAKFNEQIDARQERASAIQDAERRAISSLAEVAGSRDRAMRIAAAIGEVNQARQALQAAQGGGEGADNLEALRTRLAEREVAIEQLLDAAGGRAAQMIHDARAYRWQRALTERGRALRLTAQADAYSRAPEYYRNRLFLDTLAEGLRDKRKTVIAVDEGTAREIRLDLQDEGAELSNFIGEN